MEKGLVLVTRPTGSGKSTTLAAIVDYANRRRRDHIVTIEDPLECQHRSRTCIVNHREVHRDTMSFGAALRGALREDPDIILVGDLLAINAIFVPLAEDPVDMLEARDRVVEIRARYIPSRVDGSPGETGRVFRRRRVRKREVHRRHSASRVAAL